MRNKIQIFIWALYDWANSSFTTIVTTFIFGYYYTQTLAPTEVQGTAEWGNAQAVAGILIAVLSPVFGSIADYQGRRLVWLNVFSWLCIIATACLWFAYPSPDYATWALLCLVIGTVAMEIAIVFYNAMLPSITNERYYGRVSGWAWSLGYVGGLVSLVIALYGFVKTPPAFLDQGLYEHVRLCGPFVGLWFAVFALPLLIWGPSNTRQHRPWHQALKLGLSDLKHTLTTLPSHRDVFRFLLARLFYIDGLNTVFAFGGIFAGGVFGMDTNEVIEFGIAMNVAAGAGAYVFAWVDDFWGPKETILLSLVALTCLGIIVVTVESTTWFVGVTMALSVFFGPVQAASRSLMARLVPAADKANEFFGLYALSGKITAFLGPALLAWVTEFAQSQRIGMASVLVFFVIGGLLLITVRAK